ncbi:MAG TPA: hypothetical protein VGP46_13140 [Acidimicrobiales bacterium]|jgi:hypothetical protein|nr:hypothetical protein [Acidimicrobiales bacterium]
MAELLIEGDELVVKMSTAERLEAVHGEVRVPVTSISRAWAVPSAWPELRGIRAPGTGIPNVVAVGTRRGQFGKDFAVVHGTGPAVVVELEGADYQRIVVTTDDAETVASQLEQARGRG